MIYRRTAATAVLGLALLAGCGSEFAAQAPATQPSSIAAPRAAEGFRLVGYNDVAIEVAASWGTNQAQCGTPTKDTVQIDVGAVRACGSPRGKDVDSVSVAMTDEDYRFDGGAGTTAAGRPALRTPTTCAKDNFGGARTCQATVHFPAEGVVFTAESSTSREEVDTILGRIRAVPGSVGVPGFRDDNWSADDEEHGRVDR